MSKRFLIPEDYEDVHEIYADGGVIWDGKPGSSMIGGTFAWCHVNDAGDRIIMDSGMVYPHQCLHGKVTNNVTELVACVRAIQAAPDGFVGTLFSDSENALGRFFRGWKMKNVPYWLGKEMAEQIKRISRGDIDVNYILLDGHPTKWDMQRGIGKRGHPVSVHNAWCDDQCTVVAKSVRHNLRTPEQRRDEQLAGKQKRELST